MLAVKSSQAPEPVGPYSQAISVGGMLYLSGQVALDPASGQMVEGGIEAQAVQVFKNLEQVLLAGDSDLEHVVKTTVLLTNMNDFAVVNSVYAKVFENNKVMPARTTFAVSALPKSALVEVDCVALRVMTRVSVEEMALAAASLAQPSAKSISGGTASDKKLS